MHSKCLLEPNHRQQQQDGPWWSFMVAAALEPRTGDLVTPAPDEQAEAEAGPVDRGPAPVDLRRRESEAGRRRRPRRGRGSGGSVVKPKRGSVRRPIARGPWVGVLGVLLLAALLLPRPAHAQAGVVIEYYHLDALGTVRAVTDAGGNLVRSHDVKPFGEEVRDAQGQVQLGDRKLFTGQERDTETGFDYFGARYYQARLGRFITTDPAKQAKLALAVPQRWNRYAYATNSPLRFVDPDGRWGIDVHQYLTAALAYAAGASRGESAQIGWWDQRTDENPETKPVSTDRTHYLYHFVTTSQASALLFTAGDPGSESFGYALHSFQDSFIHPHNAIGSGLLHLVQDVDATSKHPNEALKMAQETYDILKNSVDGLPGMPWPLLEPLVKKFIAAKNLKQKQAVLDNIYFLANAYLR